MYDSETKLYYMHARYYDPEAGRFIMKDPVSGSLSNPITQNSYIYCANDPVNKIDPAGTQFFTTAVIPPDPPSKPPECYSTCSIPLTYNGLMGSRCRDCSHKSLKIGDDYSECQSVYCKLEGDDLNNFYLLDANGNVIKPPNFNPAYYTGTYTALSGSLGNLTAISDDSTPDSGIIEQPNKDYDIKYEVDEDGNVKLSAVDKDGNPVKLPESEQRVLDNIQKGMNDALNWLRDQGFIFSDLRASKKVIMNFISKYASMFYRITGGETAENAYELAYNATIGLAIACEMKTLNDKYYRGDYDKGQYNQEIGFWVSFYSRKSGMNLSFKHGDVKGTKGLDTVLGLVEVAVLMKALMYKENGTLDPGRTHKNDDETIDYGLMMLNSFWFPKAVNAGGIFAGLNFLGGNWKTNPFYNIGGGIGVVFNNNKFTSSNPPTLMQWFKAVNLYNPGDEYFSEVVKYFHWMMGGYKIGVGELTGDRSENPFTDLGWKEWYKTIAGKIAGNLP